MISKKMF